MFHRNQITAFMLLSLCIAATILPHTRAELPRPGRKTGDAKWVRISVNMVTATDAEVLSVVDKAKAAGATTIVLDDVKFLTWWFRSPGATWLLRMHKVRDGIRAKGLDFVITSEGLGYCHGPLAYDVNLAAGYPIVDNRMRVAANGKTLRSMDAPVIDNPSFEQLSPGDSNVPLNWGYQDDPGSATFVDSSVSRTGSRSMRLHSLSSRSSTRIYSADIPVRKYHQYTLSAWMRTDSLKAGYVAILIRDSATDLDLTKQKLSFPDGKRRSYFTSVSGVTTDGWVEQRLSFNSLETTKVSFILGIWSGSSGRMWWDDVKMTSTPLLNLLRRNSLPFRLSTANATTGRRTLRDGRDYVTVKDPKLGKVLTYSGVYDTYHREPKIKLVKRRARLSPRKIVFLSGYHTMVTMSGQVGCSWSDAGVKSVIETTHFENDREFAPDGVMLGHNEIRTGGWEPKEVKMGSGGKALAAFLKWEIKAVRRVTQSHPYLYMWSDMIDPNHNAVANYYQTSGSLEAAWKGASHKKVVVLNWLGNSKVPESYKFFDDKGYTQIASAFYDTDDVAENRANWVSTFAGKPSAGSMYTTWVDTGDQPFDGDFSQLQSFGDIWW